MRFLKIGDASKELNISPQTLRRWVDENKIPHKTTPGGHRFIDIEGYLKDNNAKTEETKEDNRKQIFYCRVSSSHQKDDLERQIKLASEKYPKHEIISDIGSGLNYKRKGLKSLLERVMCGDVKEVVIFHKDRLCRFGYELFEFIFNANKTELLVHDNFKGEFKSTEQELAEDILSIVTIFSCRQMGKRRYSSVKNDEEQIN